MSRFTPIEPKRAVPLPCRYILSGQECPFASECRYSHTATEPATDNATLYYFLEDRIVDKKPHTVLCRTFEENNVIRLDIPKTQLKNTHVDLFWGTCYPNFFVPKNTFINHFPNSHEITDKSCMHANLCYDFVPTTFVVPKQLNEFAQCKEAMWIIKPVGKGGGKGISVITVEQVLDQYLVDKSDFSSLKIREKAVVCKYITNPLLVDHKKVDFRMYVLLKDDQIYFYNEGIVRTASEDYTNDPASYDNLYIHLTNNSVNNKKMREEKDAREGFYKNKYMKSFLDQLGFSYEPLYDLIRTSVKETIYHEKKRGNVPYDNCFELLGFDILLDDQLRPYLLEVNGLPDLNAMSRNGRVILDVDFDVKSKLLADVLNIVFGCNDLGNFIRL
jgi:hypothetical protein